MLKTPEQIVGDNAWRGAYDPVRDRFLIPTTKNGFVWTIIGGDGTDQTQRTPTGVPYTNGNGSFWVSGLALDLSKRKGYLYDHAKMELWEADLDTLAIRRVATLADTPLTGTSGTRITWHPDLRAVIVGASKLHAYEVDTGKRLWAWRDTRSQLGWTWHVASPRIRGDMVFLSTSASTRSRFTRS